MLPACLLEQLLWLVGDGSALSHVVACAMRGVRLFADLREFRGIKLPTLGADIGSRTLSVNFWHESEKNVVSVSGLCDTLIYVGLAGKLAPTGFRRLYVFAFCVMLYCVRWSGRGLPLRRWLAVIICDFDWWRFEFGSHALPSEL